MADILKGGPVASAISEDLIIRTKQLKARGIHPCLAILRVGERADDLAYERGAVKRCEAIGIDIRHYVLPQDVTQNRLMETITLINADPSIHGCLMFRPLPKTLDEKAACAALDPGKDIDGISPASMAMVYAGYGDGFAPCTPQSCLELLRHYRVEISGKRVAVIGRSMVIGRPVAMLLTVADGTVTLCHSKTRNLSDMIREADIVIVAVGKAESIGADCFHSGQVVVDVGINWSDAKQKLVGDVDFDAVEPVVSAITPVPAGVGSVTTAVLCKHVIEAAERF